MNAILGMTSIAEKQLGDPDKLADCLGKIRISGNHLLGLINEVLDMSKIESGNVSLSENTFLVSDTLNTVMQIIRSDAESKEQQIVLRSDLRHDAVHGDFMRVQQILLNLLSNAVKYTGTGGHISLTAEERVSGRSGVGCFEFTVEDDGIGMPPEFLDKLFTPFERAKDARVSGVQGTGLGLAITHNLVQMMNGTIRVESQPDQGYPVHRDHLPQAGGGGRAGGGILFRLSGAAGGGVPSRHAASSGGGQRPQPGDRPGASGHGRAGDRLRRKRQAGGGPLRLPSAGRLRPHPDGHPDARHGRLRGHEGDPEAGPARGRPDAADIPIIALTANAFADDVYRARQAGMNEHVTKPLEIDRLLETLHRWIG